MIPDRMTKRELLYADIAYMRDVEGRKWKDIAGIVGLSLGMAHAYYHDPTGEKARARKMKRARACLDCGATINTDGSVTDVSVRCQKCHTASGAKPERVCHWLFAVMGLRRTDTLVDLYHGSGAVKDAWGSWTMQFPIAA